MDKRIKVLVITHAPWRNDTSIGNSYSNIFANMDDKLEFAQIYIRDGEPENNLVHDYFCISEKKLIKSTITRQPVGKKFHLDNPMETHKTVFTNKYNFMRKLRWDVFLLGRDVASSAGKWKTKELDDFLDWFKPDIIFGSFIFTPIVNQLMVYARRKTNAKLVIYSWDDWYRFNKYSHSLFYRVRYPLEKHYQQMCASQCSFMYTITKEMKEEYEELFNIPCKVLKKGFEFRNDYQKKEKKVKHNPLKVVYTGNIGDKRWVILAEIAKAIEAVNREGTIKFCQYIYTLSPIDEEMKRALDVSGASVIKGAVPSTEIPSILDDADILIHVEPTDKAKLHNCRLSFSTKIVDYLYTGKCVMAIGGQNASMSYLKENDAAIVIKDTSKIQSVLTKISNNPKIIDLYGEKAWECGKRNHDITKIQAMIFRDFNEVIKNGRPIIVES